MARRVFDRTSPVDNAGPVLRKDGRKLLQFSSNDYLGLARHSLVRAAAVKTVERYGVSAPMGARPLTGTIESHRVLEEQVAQFKQTERAVIFSTGADAMMGSIASLVGRRDLVVFDQYAHASLIWGAKVANAVPVFFSHNNPIELESLLAGAGARQAKVVVVNGVYSMRGDISPLAEISDVCRRYGARLVVDDAHGTGACGTNGRGSAELLEVEDRVDLHLGTFSKAIGTVGGFAAGPRDVIEYIRFTAPSLIFTKAMPACVAASTLVALEIVRDGHVLRQKLWRNAKFLQEALRTASFDIGSPQTPITPIMFRNMDALYISDLLEREYGIWASAVLYPAIPLRTSLLRIVPTARHKKKHLKRLVEALDAARREVSSTCAYNVADSRGSTAHR